MLPGEWASLQVAALSSLLGEALHGLVLIPARRWATRRGRDEARFARTAREVNDALDRLRPVLSREMESVYASLLATEKFSTQVVKEFEGYFGSAPVASLARQALALRLQLGERQVSGDRLRGPVSLSLRVVAPAAYREGGTLVVDEIASLIWKAVSQVIGDLKLSLGDLANDAIKTLMLERCQWQLESIDSWLELVAKPLIRVDDFTSFRERYVRAVTTTFYLLPTPHWDGQPRAPIDRVYVPGRFGRLGDIQVEEAEFNESEVDSALDRLRMDHAQPPVTTPAPLAESGAERAVLVGDPGAGKSSYASHLMYKLASGDEMIGSVARVPFLVTLREYRSTLHRSAESMSFVEFIERQCAQVYQVRPPVGAIEFTILSGSGAVIFDGLDEILDFSERLDIVTRIEVFARLYPNCPILVTSRWKGFAQAAPNADLFETYVLLPYDRADIDRYIESWFALDEGVPSGTQVEQKRLFRASLSELDSKLTTNPLTLALLCNLFKAGGYLSLPRSRSEIYEKCSLMLYDRWDRRRGIGTADFEREILPVIAFAAHQILDHPSLAAGFTERELTALCLDYLVPLKFDSSEDARVFAKALIEHCVGRAWVFSAVSTNENLEEVFGFTHRTFLEYFAALHLARSVADPSQLARTMSQWIRSRERWLVTGMAFEIKARQLDRGAELMVEALLGDLAEDEDGKLSMVEWLCEEATRVPIGESTLKALIGVAVGLPETESVNCMIHLATASGNNRRVVDSEVIRILSDLIDERPPPASVSRVIEAFRQRREGGERAPWTRLLKVITPTKKEDGWTSPHGLR